MFVGWKMTMINLLVEIYLLLAFYWKCTINWNKLLHHIPKMSNSNLCVIYHNYFIMHRINIHFSYKIWINFSVILNSWWQNIFFSFFVVDSNHEIEIFGKFLKLYCNNNIPLQTNTLNWIFVVNTFMKLFNSNLLCAFTTSKKVFHSHFQEILQ